MIRIEVAGNNASEELRRLVSAFSKPSAALKAIGETMMAFTKDRFRVSQDPYGTPWAPNKASTLANFLRLHPKNFNKSGGVSDRGAEVLSRKRPLIGETRSLSTQFAVTVLTSSVEVRSTRKYAAMQNFGGPKKKFTHLWGDIPARAFFPDERKGLPVVLANKTSRILRDSITRHRN